MLRRLAMKRIANAVAFALALAVVVALGYRHGEATRSARIAPSAMAMVKKPIARSPRNAATDDALPSDLWSLDGSEFVAKMPALEKRARGGDLAATHVLVSRLQTCSTYRHRDEDDIRRDVDAQYEQQLGVQKQIEAHGPVDLKFRIDEKWRDDLLRTYLDERDRCEALTPADLDRRYDWASLALARHDRDTTLRLASFGSLAPNASERVREPDRLADLQRQLVGELDRLVDTGDVEAMSREAYLFRNPTSTVIDVADPARSYAIGYALSLAADGNDDAVRAAASAMEDTAKSLSPEAIEQARREGEALYARCCRNGLVFH
jgi:hypothetical protein